MKIFKKGFPRASLLFAVSTLAVCTLAVSTLPVHAQTSPDGASIPLNDFSAFRESGPNWTIGSDALADIHREGFMKAIPGTGVAVDILGQKDNKHLITKDEFGDLELELDFMMAKNANSGVYLQGRYEVQLLDSWTKIHPEFSDCGGIYQRWDDARGDGHQGYEGIAPLMNVSRAPGLWQHLKIRFQAPQFNTAGQKIRNARFLEVYLNGVLVQLQEDVTGPTRSSAFDDEKPTGPLMLQGDHGDVAFRNIHYKPLGVSAQQDPGDNPILLKADGKPYLLRSFLNYGDKKLTHVISAGYPSQLNFSYDLKEGALFQVWRGQFLDVTDMWHERGEPQLAKPLGSVIVTSDAPTLAILPDHDATWPDSVGFDDFHNRGYTLDDKRFPAFEYEYNGIRAIDKISAPSAYSLMREIKVTDPPANLYARIVAGSIIETVGEGVYAIDGKSYYIQIDPSVPVLLRKTKRGRELLVPVDKNTNPVTYSITW
ncbi:MAG: DUF1080 domain-containing protein [Puia sp.]|nr:DUF1080 domain-containing protein [Puia sp.]